MAAATKVFIERGYGAGSVQAIGRLAGVTNRAIYELVGDKEALFQAVCAKLWENATEFHFNAADTDLPLREILLDMATTLLDIALSPATVGFSRMIAAEALRFPDLVVSAMDVARHHMSATMANVFVDLANRQLIQLVDPPKTADTFYDVIVGSRALRAILGYDEPMPPMEETESRVDMFLKGYLHVNPTPEGGDA